MLKACSFGSDIKTNELKGSVQTPTLNELQNKNWFFNKKSPDGLKTVFFITPDGHEYFGKSNSRKGNQYDEYYFELENGQIRTVEAHDYNKIYESNGWKYKFILDCLDYQTPKVTAQRFMDMLNKAGMDSKDIRVLDMAAGSGMGYEELLNQGFKGKAFGQDIVPNAKMAASYLSIPYDEYVISDLSKADKQQLNAVKFLKPNALLISAGLGEIDHLGPLDLYQGIRQCNFEEQEKIPIVFNLDQNVRENPEHPTMMFVNLLKNQGFLKDIDEKKYTHRKLTNGDRVYTYLFSGWLDKPLKKDILEVAEALQRKYSELTFIK